MTFKQTFGGAVLATALALGLAANLPHAVAQDASATPATKPAARRAGKMPRMVQPYSLMSSLSDEQKYQIDDVRKETAAKRKALAEEERQQILALLSPEQVREMERVVADKKAADKARNAERARARKAAQSGGAAGGDETKMEDEADAATDDAD